MHAVEVGLVSQAAVTELGAVLSGTAEGRRSADEITVFDSTGLAIQDLAIGIEVVNRYREGTNASSFSSVQAIEIG